MNNYIKSVLLTFARNMVKDEIRANGRKISSFSVPEINKAARIMCEKTPNAVIKYALGVIVLEIK